MSHSVVPPVAAAISDHGDLLRRVLRTPLLGLALVIGGAPAQAELPSGTHGYLSTDGTPAGAFVAFVVSGSGEHATWKYKQSSPAWPSSEVHLVVDVALNTSSWVGPSFSTTEQPFSQAKKPIISGPHMYEGTYVSGGATHELTLIVRPSLQDFAWYTTENTDYLPGSTTFELDPIGSVSGSQYRATNRD